MHVAKLEIKMSNRNKAANEMTLNAYYYSSDYNKTNPVTVRVCGWKNGLTLFLKFVNIFKINK